MFCKNAKSVKQLFLALLFSASGFVLLHCGSKSTGPSDPPIGISVATDSMVFDAGHPVRDIVAHEGILYVTAGSNLYSFDTADLSEPIDSFSTSRIARANSYFLVDSARDRGFICGRDSIAIVRLGNRGYVTLKSKFACRANFDGERSLGMCIVGNSLFVNSKIGEGVGLKVFDISNLDSAKIVQELSIRITAMVAADSFLVIGMTDYAPASQYVCLMTKELVEIDRTGFDCLFGTHSPSTWPTAVFESENGLTWVPIIQGRFYYDYLMSPSDSYCMSSAIQAGPLTIFCDINETYLVTRVNEFLESPFPMFYIASQESIVDACVQSGKLFVADSGKVRVYSTL